MSGKEQQERDGERCAIGLCECWSLQAQDVALKKKRTAVAAGSQGKCDKHRFNCDRFFLFPALVCCIPHIDGEDSSL